MLPKFKNPKEKAPKSLEEELERNFDDCWDVHYGPDGPESYFSTDSAIRKSLDAVKTIAIEYNSWFAQRLSDWISSPLDFPEMEGDAEGIYEKFLSERYSNGQN